MPLVNPPPDGPALVKVIKTEEKGSDVNLATAMVADAFRGDAQCYVVVSTDSDLAAPVKIVATELGHTVGVIAPRWGQRRNLDEGSPTFTRRVRQGLISACQFPEVVVTPDGSKVKRPSTW